MRQVVDGEDSLLRALGYCEEDFISPRLPQAPQLLQQPQFQQLPQPQLQQPWQQPWSPMRSSQAALAPLLGQSAPVSVNGHMSLEDLLSGRPYKPPLPSHHSSPASLTSDMTTVSPASVLAIRAWDMAEQLAEKDTVSDDTRTLRSALQAARERESSATAAHTEAEAVAHRAKMEVVELRAEWVGSRRREEALAAELRAEKAEAAASSERLAAEVLALREKARAQARHDEVKLDACQLEVKRLQFELQTAVSRSQLELAETRSAMQEEIEQHRAQKSDDLMRARAEAARLESERVELLERVESFKAAALEFATGSDSLPSGSQPKAPRATSSSAAAGTESAADAPAFSTDSAPPAPSTSTEVSRPPPEPASLPKPPPEPGPEPQASINCAPAAEEIEVDGSKALAEGSRSQMLEAEKRSRQSSPSASGRPPRAPNSPTCASQTGSSIRDDRSESPSSASRSRPETDGSSDRCPDRESSRGRGDEEPQKPSGKGGEMLGRDLFRRAEALCSQQRHEEAIPLFEEVLSVLREHGQEVLDRRALVVAQADVWAHLGVSMQSLDRMHEALASYGRAVALNPLLHACFANLATLHLYLRNTETARRHIGKALSVKPEEAAYLEIQKEVESQARKHSGSSASSS